MKERLDNRKLSGNINVACKYDDGTVRYWSTTKEDVISHIVSIVNEYSSEGYVLTLRQLHYQLVTQNWIVNHDSAYKKLGNILDDCRYAGIVDWDAIEDRGRRPYLPYWVTGLSHALMDTYDQYRLDRQAGQQTYVELWTEKDALSGILRRSTEKYHVQLVVNKGYTSSSAIYSAYQRISDRIINGQNVTILYFGDHDPSGLDMVRDIKERLIYFLSRGERLQIEEFDKKVIKWWQDSGYTIYSLIDYGYCSERIVGLLSVFDDDLNKEFEAGRIAYYLNQHDLFQVKAIGLTMEQINTYKLPPNPTKLTDSRASSYVKKFGKTCWEVDALKPNVLTSIVESNIKGVINLEQFESMRAIERDHKNKLAEIINGLTDL